MPHRTYDVIAMSFPIVYTNDGDHDPNGLLYTLRAYRPLLGWARDRWEDNGEYLPLLHLRRQRIQVLLDGLGRYEHMVDRLKSKPKQFRHLLGYLGRDEGPDDSGRPLHPVRHNLRATVDELVAVLDKLTDGAITRLPRDRRKRASLAKEWRKALADADHGLGERLAAIQAQFDAPALAAESGLTEARVRRLLLNDRSANDRSANDRNADGPNAYDRFHPVKPIPLVRPLVLRARRGETVEVRLENEVRGRRVGLHLQGAGLGGPGGAGVRHGDGAHVGRNPDTTVAPGQRRSFLWEARHEGVWVVNDLADLRGTQAGTNAHGLFGAFVVEPAGATWRDPETGEDLTDTTFADGLSVDIYMPDEQPGTPQHLDFIDFHQDGVPRSHREFTIFLHDEPEIHSGLHHDEHDVMPISYRAEPMPNRLPHRMRRYAEATEQGKQPSTPGPVDLSAVQVTIDDELNEVFRVARRHGDGEFLEFVSGEEQHHSSWLFGEPSTPVLRAYRGDPARVRLVHAGVKETHVFHLHVHQWRAVPTDTARPGRAAGSQLLDSITIGPQTSVTIDPLYGSGSRQKAVGDIIWHCHLYPHFHHGMWGLWRSFDRLVNGSRSYPDRSPCPELKPLPGRPPAPVDDQHPGFPQFIDASFPQKSPPPPALLREHRSGRRDLLKMGDASPEEIAAFDPGAAEKLRPGQLFVDLDGDAETWNEAAGLPRPRIIRYDVEVHARRVAYNARGWMDLQGHEYVLTGVRVDGEGQPLPPEGRPVPLFIRANHGDVVELQLTNELGTIPSDAFDLTQLPVECGLHVHLVKFDVLAADGSSVGWNYLAGASSREAIPEDTSNRSFHRWVVDEEFGPCFFHDHLLANYRQKHGLFAALVAQPHGSRWTLPERADVVAWSGLEAVVVPDAGTGMTPYREACLAVGDFVPLVDGDGKPLNPPGDLGGDDDPGSMAVNYRSTPLTFRGDDPSEWFASRPDHGDPDTDVFRTYPGERLRIRLIQGSHEEQHSFALHGLRWRREWHVPASALVNQQTIGISEAFTLDVNPHGRTPYGPGDYLWAFPAMDDLWLGCWGLIRALWPTHAHLAELPALPETDPGALLAVRSTLDRPAAPAREYVVAARRVEHRYDGDDLTDPWGLMYAVADGWEPVAGSRTNPHERRATGVRSTVEPLVLRARRGEWIKVTLINELFSRRDLVLPPFGPERKPPELPLDEEERTVSPRVSLHPSLLRYDVITEDGAYVGRNRDGTVPPLRDSDDHDRGHVEGGRVVHRDDDHDQPNWREYWWYADEDLAPASHAAGPGQVCWLQDMADVRNHRHHGLIGALVVEPGDVTPVDPTTGEERWTGTHVQLRHDGALVADEQVLLVQDGLRHFVAGNPLFPVPDVEPGDDPEDSGQKGINYRTALVHHRRDLNVDHPPTPIWRTTVGDRLWLRLVYAADKPRNHTFTIHNQAWPLAPWRRADSPMIGSLSGLTTASVHDIELLAESPGDHAYRTGVFKWALEQGLWGILRVEER